jgi:cyclopropane-fatty-acyl-phospholipid synthase
MSLIAQAVTAFENAPVPDAVRRIAVGMLVENARRGLASAPADAEARFLELSDARPIADHTEAANRQHYEVPAAFFEAVLGPRLKYSCCLYPTGSESLVEAEELALAETAARADLQNGQEILELGCGWGSLSLWMAWSYPGSRITAVSNSASQAAFIRSRAEALGIDNLAVITADMNQFQTPKRFDRVVSVEMFEHMANWRALLGRVRDWLKPDGRVFIHVFTHRTTPYAFDVNDDADWIGKYFFSGGIMPSHSLMHRFPDLFEVEADWTWNGQNYERTALDWLANYDGARETIRPILKDTYGKDAALWGRRWRLFFLATAGLFGAREGSEWGVSHYRLKPA